ncbi:MAG TPA: amidohydrolase family protein [Beijerinckiaceae bacterium]|nr:amidohydrolase family protein [Beijerinckiaceae bacterium]
MCGRLFQGQDGHHRRRRHGGWRHRHRRAHAGAIYRQILSRRAARRRPARVARPAIEMTMGHGMPGIQGALDHGIRPSLSSDVDTTMAQDPFTIMRTTLTLQRALVLQRERQGEKNLPPLLTARDVLEFATIEGARCAHLDHKTGSLTPGKQADLILLRTDSLSAWPINNAARAGVLQRCGFKRDLLE